MKETNDQSQRLVGDCFFVRQGERMEKCFYSEVLYVEASGGIVIFIVGISPSF